ncbi:myophilin-like isoform X1 [Amphiura filiformis]|uniref:myophilin-like isoform X1 n=1 Tax=Amphiura filiformis TaxID=82378 RepID=UPI003B214CAA
MANQGKAYGMSARVAAKIEGKRDPEVEDRCRQFIEHLTGEKVTSAKFEDDLKNGVVICKLINALHPGGVPKIETSNMPFKQRVNIENFIEACKAYGLKEQEVFGVNDLFEAKNVPQFTQCIVALGRRAQMNPSYNGPLLGPKQATENKREFSEEQLEAGKYIHSLQMGSNKGASQAGQNFGVGRQIITETDEGQLPSF